MFIVADIQGGRILRNIHIGFSLFDRGVRFLAIMGIMAVRLRIEALSLGNKRLGINLEFLHYTAFLSRNFTWFFTLEFLIFQMQIVSSRTQRRSINIA